MRRRLTAFLLLALAVPVLAADSVRLTFDAAGERRAWIDAAWPSVDPGERAVAGDAVIDVATKGADPKAFVWVLDAATGNLARKTVGDAAAAWKPAASDYKWIGRVRVRVQHEGKPVSSAQVVVNDGSRRQDQLLSPSDNGELTFWAVKPGMVRFGASYKSGGAQRDLPAMAMELKLQRDRPDVVVVLPIPDPVETVTQVAAATKGDAKTSRQAPTAKPRNPLGSILVLFGALALGAGALYAAFRWMSANRNMVESKLKDLGVEVPGPLTNAADVAPASAPVAPAKFEPIVLDPVAPVILGESQVGLGPATGPLRLVSDAGVAFAPQEGPNRVGRDEGLPLSLPTESTVSRQHAEIRLENGSLVVVDLGSTNGTFVNGIRISADTPLQPGDQVQFGAVRFRVER